MVSPSDGRGVSYHLSFRCMPDMVRAIDQILLSKRFPLGSRGDLLRFALREGLRKLEALEPVISVTQRIDLVNTLLAEENAHHEFQQIFTHIDDTLAKYMGDQAVEQAIRLLAVTKHHFEEMPEGYWRERYLATLHERYGKVLALAPKGVPLTLKSAPPLALAPKGDS